MKIDIRSRSQAAVHIVLLAALVFSSLLLPLRATAALGGDEASVEADRQQMKAQRAVRASANYSVHEITTPYGTTVREYVSPDGKVFGVAWKGQTVPDLHLLLGDYSNQLDQAVAAQGIPRRRGPMVIKEPGLVVVSGGHMRAFRGKAYLPSLLPESVQPEDIQ
jgi:hypothetical protein